MSVTVMATCKDCRITAECGTGSYAQFPDVFSPRSIEVFLDSPPEQPEVGKVVNLRAFLTRHRGHDTRVWSWDWCDYEGDDLMLDPGGYVALAPFIPGERLFRHVDLTAIGDKS